MSSKLFTWRHTKLELRKSSKETACCREHPSRNFRMPRNEDSQNMKHLPTWSSGTSHCQLSRSEKHTTRSQTSWHSFVGRSLVLPGLVFSIALQLPSLLWSPCIAVCDVIRMKQPDRSATIVVHLEQKLNRPLTRIFFSACEKYSGHKTISQ